MDSSGSIARNWYEQARRRIWSVGRTALLRQNAPAPVLHQELLGIARSLVGRGEYRSAAVIAQTACEVLTEQVVRRLLKVRGADFLEEWTTARVRTFDLDNDTVRKLYVALSADQIESHPFWSRYQAHVQRRHGIVHRGDAVTRAEAQESCDAAADLIKHLEPML